VKIGLSISISGIGGAATAWTPASLGADLALWLDADDASTITLNGSTVSQWNDKSGNGFHLTQATAASQPSYLTNQLNGKPVIRNANGDFMLSASSPVLRNVSQGWMVAVAKYPTAANNGANGMLMVVKSGTGGTRMALTAFPNTNTNALTVGGRRLDTDTFLWAASSSTTRASVQDTWMIEIGNLNYGAAQANHWTNGTQDLTAASFLTAGNSSDTDATEYGVFAFAAANAAAPNGTEIAEAFILENAVSTEDRQKLEGYLAWKWGGI
jgi:hypothetical protein